MSLLNQLTAFANQRPQIEWADYCDHYYIGQDRAKVTRQLADYRVLSARVGQLIYGGFISEDRLREASNLAFSGRLQFTDRGIQYCTGQHWSVEFRAAACAVLASVLWDFERERLSETVDDWRESADLMRKNFRQQFGRGIASRWFN